MVIAVIGVLAAIVLLAINPAQQFAQARDSSRRQTVSALGRAVAAYATTHGNYPNDDGADAGTWMQKLIDAGEIKQPPEEVEYSDQTLTVCSKDPINGWCYEERDFNNVAIVFVRMEWEGEQDKCATDQYAWYLWDSKDNKSGVVCYPNTQQPRGQGHNFVSD